MSELHQHDPTGRFTGLAPGYARYRPDYPAAAVDALVEAFGLDGSTLVVDLGSGTGISARQLAGRGIPVLGIEPNEEMRRQAEAEPVADGLPRPRYQGGRGEATGLPDGIAAAVLAAQSFHWLEPDAAFREIQRILRAGGGVALLWNERDESDPFTHACGEAIRSAPDAARFERFRAEAGLPLLHCPLFEGARRLTFPHGQVLDEEALLGRAFSISYAPRDPDAAARLAAALRQAFRRFEQGGSVRLCYLTTLFLARRPGEGVKEKEDPVT